MFRPNAPALIALTASLGFALPSSAADSTDNRGSGSPTLVSGTCVATVVPVWVIIDGCHVGLRDVLLPNGCSITDAVNAVAENTDGRGEFVHGVNSLARDLASLGFMTGRLVGQATQCAAWSGIS